MPRKNLTKEIIVTEAIDLINQDGYAKFTLQALSRHLDIKAPSLYNHFKNLDEINVEVFKKLVNEYSPLNLHTLTACAEKKQFGLMPTQSENILKLIRSSSN